MIVAFDVDGTLITLNDKIRFEVVDQLRWWLKRADRVIIWSGGGKGYAEHNARRLGLEEAVICLNKCKDAGEKYAVDICFDDENVQLAKVNVRV